MYINLEMYIFKGNIYINFIFKSIYVCVYTYIHNGTSLVAHMVKNLPAMQEI